MNNYLPKTAKVIDAYSEADNSSVLTLKLKWGRLKFCAGQFAMLGLPGWGEAPFDICSSPLNSKFFQFCIRRVGGLSQKLADLKKGDEVLVRGPLGNGFNDLAKLGAKNILFLGGGCGFVTVRPIIKEIIERELHKEKGVQLFYGARSEENILFRKEQEEWAKSADVKIILENPKTNKFRRGIITDLIKTAKIPEDVAVIMCGPPIMYRFCIAALGKKCRPEATYLLMERRMHCGVGVCQHCALGPYYVCKDGPVFTLKMLNEANVQL
ncbi:MAG: FAD/NAD(P)-binding protein [Patescibacteria group bacterium]